MSMASRYQLSGAAQIRKTCLGASTTTKAGGVRVCEGLEKAIKHGMALGYSCSCTGNVAVMLSVATLKVRTFDEVSSSNMILSRAAASAGTGGEARRSRLRRLT